ncbi:hypothetical protein [Psychromarinibacter sp. S121]|uniref:hypothetical protein n=1 Tax=Psychromarinibacter sp. S121 TaxID=3415127 RepID=UPI003C7C5ECC
MSGGKGPSGSGSKNWEHSRYKDWRPNYRETPAPSSGGGGGGRDRRPPRRRSITGRVLRFVIAIAVIVGLAGPGADFANGLAKAPDGGCAVRVVVDGGRLTTHCPDGADLPMTVAGYDAPSLTGPGCWAEFKSAFVAGLELRKLLFAADVVQLQGPGVVAPQADVAPAPEPDGEDVPEAEAATGETDPEATETAEDTPPAPAASAVPAGRVRVLVDGADVAPAMLEAGIVRPVGSGGWCQ